jgi:dihydrofolate synthase/folylpolyglutamate synthase
MLSQLPMYQQKGKQAYRPDLSRMEAFCSHLNSPEKKIKTIHIAGTNGKGSTAHMIASVLQEAGYRVGLYTSPHLRDFRERIKINGAFIEKQYIVKFIQNNLNYFDLTSLSFFEMTVGLAFSYFFDKKVDYAVIEVGMGGRLDGTNLILPELSIITNIGFDHIQFLGNTLPEIANEKAGIIKPKTPLIIGETHEKTKEVFIERAKMLNSQIIFADQQKFVGFSSDLKGSYQKKNIQTASIALLRLKIDPKIINSGLMKVIPNTGIQGRWQILANNPLTIADVAHNQEGLDYVIPQIKSQSYNKLHLVLGFVKDKVAEKLLRLFPENAIFYFAAPNIPRALPIADLEKVSNNLNLNFKTFPTVAQAMLKAQSMAGSNDLIYVGGSTFVVAEIL